MKVLDTNALEGLTPKQQRYVRQGHRMALHHPKGGHWFSDVNRVLIRLTRWRLGGSIQGVTIGLLTTTGRHSGRARTVPVVCLEDGPRFLVAASNSGLDSAPAWCLNLRAQPDAEMQTRAGTEGVVAHELDGVEREESWGRLAEYNPVLGGYQACTGRRIALFALKRPERQGIPMIRSTVTIERPIEEVFDYAAQFDRHPEWQEQLKSATADGPPAVGATGTGVRQIGSKVHTTPWRMSAYERPTILGWEILSGPMRPVGTMRFSAERTSTRVEIEIEMNPRGLMKLVGPLIERQAQKIVPEHLAKFKDILERGR